MDTETSASEPKEESQEKDSIESKGAKKMRPSRALRKAKVITAEANPSTTTSAETPRKFSLPK